MQTGVWKTEHGMIPNVVPGVGEQGGEIEDEEEEEYEGDEDSEEEDEDEGEDPEQSSKGGWNPTLESIVEEV
jgi:hypothetical protein